MEDLIKFLIEPIVSDPAEIKIEKTQEEKSIKFLITIPKEDIAKVIGKSGKMIKAIRSLAKVRGLKENVFVDIELVEA